MRVEQLIFTVIAFAFFVYMFLKMIKENDTNYIGILVAQMIGIGLNFLNVLFKVGISPFFIVIKYMLSIILPTVVIIIVKKGMPLMQILNVFKAKYFLKFGNNKKAKEQLIKLVSKYPDNYVGHKMLAEIYEIEGGMRKAIDEYVQAIDINKQDYDSYYKVAFLLNNLDKSDEAAEMLFNLLNKRPEYYKATELLGDILLSNEMYKEAVNIYQDALKYNPTSYDLNYNLGIAYTMLNDFQNAKECYERAAKINSLLYNAKYSLAEIALIYKELEEAEKYFLLAAEDEELSADSYYELSRISIIKGYRDMAIKYANTAIDIDSSKIVPKIKKDALFIPILARISIPFNIANEIEEDRKRELLEKEIKAKEHLEDMSEITRHLSYDDIKLLNNYKKGSNTEKNQNLQKEIEDRERQD